MRKHETQQSIIKSMSWKLNPWPRENGFTGLNSNVCKGSIFWRLVERNKGIQKFNRTKQKIYFQIIDNTLHQLKGHITRITNVYVR